MGQTSSITEAVAPPIVKVQGFHKRYRKHVAVESIDPAIQSNEIYGLIGPDGAGKSSLMKSIAGVMSFEKGNIEVFGVNVYSEAAAKRVKGWLGYPCRIAAREQYYCACVHCLYGYSIGKDSLTDLWVRKTFADIKR